MSTNNNILFQKLIQVTLEQIHSIGLDKGKSLSINNFNVNIDLLDLKNQFFVEIIFKEQVLERIEIAKNVTERLTFLRRYYPKIKYFIIFEKEITESEINYYRSYLNQFQSLNLEIYGLSEFIKLAEKIKQIIGEHLVAYKKVAGILNEAIESTEKSIELPKKNINKGLGKNSAIKIFISHSSADKSLVENFIEKILLLGLDVKKEQIFCTSYSGTDIKSGDDFKLAISENIKSATAVFQIITENYKKSEICLNEMGAAWVLSDTVIPLVGHPFNYDVGFINGSSQQLKLNNEDDIFKLYDDHKTHLFVNEINAGNFKKQVRKFVEYYENYLKDTIELQKGNKQNYNYDSASTIHGILKSGIFGHPPMFGKLEEHASHHEYFYLEMNNPINVLNTNSLIQEGDFNRSNWGIAKVQIAPDNFQRDLDLASFLGKQISVTGKFMGGHTAWHQTQVLLFFSEINFMG